MGDYFLTNHKKEDNNKIINRDLIPGNKIIHLSVSIILGGIGLLITSIIFFNKLQHYLGFGRIIGLYFSILELFTFRNFLYYNFYSLYQKLAKKRQKRYILRIF